MLLDGVRVLDLSRMLAGPYGSMLLADLGAEVIKIEDPEGGDPMRVMGPPFLGPERESAYFLAINRNKKSVAINLERPEGQAILHDLCGVADVVWENFRPGVMARLGCAPETLRRLNPRLIVCSISAFGQEGPYREWPAFDLALQAMGGGMSLTGEAGRPPARMGLPMGDLAGGMFGALAVASALFRRAQTGEGAHFDLSLLDGQVSLLTYVAQYFWADGQVPGRVGSGHASVVPYQAFPTKDGHVVVAVFAEKFWAGFCRAIERPDLAADPRFDSNPNRVAAPRGAGAGARGHLPRANDGGVARPDAARRRAGGPDQHGGPGRGGSPGAPAPDGRRSGAPVPGDREDPRHSHQGRGGTAVSARPAPWPRPAYRFGAPRAPRLSLRANRRAARPGRHRVGLGPGC